MKKLVLFGSLFCSLVMAPVVGCVSPQVPSQMSSSTAEAATANQSNHETLRDDFDTVTVTARQINHISSQADVTFSTQSVPQRVVEIRFPDGTIFRAQGAGETAFESLDLGYGEDGVLQTVSIAGFNAGAVETIKANAALVATIAQERINLDSEQIPAWREAKIVEIQQVTGVARDVAIGIVDGIIAGLNPVSAIDLPVPDAPPAE